MARAEECAARIVDKAEDATTEFTPKICVASALKIPLPVPVTVVVSPEVVRAKPY